MTHIRGMTPYLPIAFTILASALYLPLRAGPSMLEPYAEIQDKAINESSGIVKSRQHENVYWTHNDSGDSARLFAISQDGKSIQTQWAIDNDVSYEGVQIEDASNIDWESIAVDDSGNLLIGAFGNNDNARRDLAIFVVPEPNPSFVWKTRATKRIDFHYPDQDAYPPKGNRNFDCEALFFANGKPYLLTKHRSDTQTKLYRLDETLPLLSNPLTLLDSFETGSQVTGADATPDGRKLAVLTYGGAWVFIAPEGTDNYFEGEIYHYAFKAKQCEAICWDDEDTLIVTNEQRDLYRIEFEDWERIQ